MKKVALHNLGCKVNSYETDAMTQMLEEAGYTIVSFNEKADAYIVNTCSVTNMADKKSRQMLHRAKKTNKDAVIIATGCYVQTATNVLEEDSQVDILVGNNQKKDIVNILNEYFESNKETTEYIVDINNTNEYEELELETVTEHTRAHIKIQDGCNNFCTYCIIPYARGRIRSRSFYSIKKEIERLANKGFREFVFTGINLSYYEDDEKSLIDVIEMANQIEGVERIRLGSLEARVITEDFVRRLAKVESICPQFHLSLQSGCNKTLKAMNRNYTSDEYFEKCELLKEYFQDPAFTTDIIVGFPGEREEDYVESREFAKKIGFSAIHVFKYSRRDGTKAAEMDNQIPEQVKNQRSEDLIEVGNSLTKQYIERRLNKEYLVLFEEKISINNEEYWVGHTTEYIKVATKLNENLAGKTIKVRLLDMISQEIVLATK